jgi:hypothetical protein
MVSIALGSAWFQPFNLPCDILVSKFAFSNSFNLCRCTKVAAKAQEALAEKEREIRSQANAERDAEIEAVAERLRLENDADRRRQTGALADRHGEALHVESSSSPVLLTVCPQRTREFS